MQRLCLAQLLAFLPSALSWQSTFALRADRSRTGCARATDEGIGSLVVFPSAKGELKLCAITGEAAGKKKKQWLAIDGDGTQRTISSREIRHVVPGARTTEAAAVSAHEDAAERAVREEARTLPDVWEVLLEESGSAAVAITTVSELLFGESTSLSCYATYYLLESEQGRVYFKSSREGLQYTPRAVKDKEALEAQFAKEAEAAMQLQLLSDRVEASAAPGGPTFDLAAESEEIKQSFEALVRLGCRAHLEPSERQELEAEPTDAMAKALLQNLGRKATEESARQLLVQLGLWSQHEDLELIRSRMPVDFSDEVVAHAQALAADPPADPDASRRLDLTHLRALAIDESSTVEVDDAVSVEELEGGKLRLWVHIADPTRYLTLGDPVEAEARSRTSSCYLPTGTVPMIPLVLAAGPLSLRPGVVSCAFSFGATINADGSFGMDELIITPSLVTAERLTYNEVDAMVEAAKNADVELARVLQGLDWVTNARQRWRIAGGSKESISDENLPDMSIKAVCVDRAADEWTVEVSVGQNRVDGVARRIVTESMLFAGEAVALFGDENGVPLPFRGQQMQEVSEEEKADWPTGPAGAWLAIRRMRPSFVAAEASAHEGLGLDAYTQVTSPIRRYPDLAVHFQLKAFFRGDPLPFPKENGQESALVSIARDAGAQQRKLERAANQYWLSVYLRQAAGHPLNAVVLGDSRGQRMYKLLLSELGAIVDYESSEDLKAGDTIRVVPTKDGKII